MTHSDSTLRGKRVTVAGLGRFGGQIAATRYLAERGAQVVVTDLADAAALEPSLLQIADLPVELHLGGHDERDFVATDMVVASPAIPPRSRYLQAAHQAGVQVTTEICLLFDACAGRIAAVTGTVGKSTTVAWAGHLLTEAVKPVCVRTRTGRSIRTRPGWRTLTSAFPGAGAWDSDRLCRHAATPYGRLFVGGNIGQSLLSCVDTIRPEDVVLLELSSFQLYYLGLQQRRCPVAVVTSLAEHHLDWHETFDAYADAKANITRYQHPGDVLICAHGQERLGHIVRHCPDGVRRYGFGVNVEPVLPGVYGIAGDAGVHLVLYDDQGKQTTLIQTDRLPLPGMHNVANATAAATLAWVLGVDGRHLGSHAATFGGLPDRLELVATIDGVRYYNDSKSTTPEACVVGLRTFDAGSIVAIVGGYDKDADFDECTQELVQRCRAVVCMGQAGGRLQCMLAERVGQSSMPAILSVDSMEQAVRAAADHARSGDVVLLSPGCSSYDMFDNYEHRGRVFRQCVQDMERAE